MSRSLREDLSPSLPPPFNFSQLSLILQKSVITCYSVPVGLFGRCCLGHSLLFWFRNSLRWLLLPVTAKLCLVSCIFNRTCTRDSFWLPPQQMWISNGLSPGWFPAPFCSVEDYFFSFHLGMELQVCPGAFFCPSPQWLKVYVL